MPSVTAPAHQKGDFLVDYEEKVFEDVKGRARREGAGHLPHRGLRRLDRPRQPAAGHAPAAQGLRDLGPALRPRRDARRAARLSQARRRGLSRPPRTSTTRSSKFMSEGGKVYACRFALQALYGHGEPSLIEGIIPINPLDVLDLSCSTARTTPSSWTPGRSEGPDAMTEHKRS